MTFEDHGRDAAENTKLEKLKVTVSFPLAGRDSFKERAELSAPAESVRLEAMGHFGVSDDASTVYYLTFNGDRIEGLTQIGSLSHGRDSLKFILSKELIQG
ncbi:MAG: hypothetical protein JWR63_3730 [Conexibacter sp.]|nr:hypothetical protein [Conexibacter sp.]